MKLIPLKLPGSFAIESRVLGDARGAFVKTFHSPTFQRFGLPELGAEQYYSVSRKGVIRGMHFQVPPMELSKLVYCVHGTVLDVMLDLRSGSPTYRQSVALEINHLSGVLLYMPAGIAHGFCALTEEAIMVYNVSAPYSAEHDAGVLWDSFGFAWPIGNPVLSERDRQFPRLEDYVSPFLYKPEKNPAEVLV